MEVAFFVLGLIAVLGVYSIHRNGKKNALINDIIQRFLNEQQGTLVNAERPPHSGPFKDEYYDNQTDNMYQNLGYQVNETVYRRVVYSTAAGQQEAWVQIRIEKLTPTYVEWKV
jgi:hypothetical protein